MRQAHPQQPTGRPALQLRRAAPPPKPKRAARAQAAPARRAPSTRRVAPGTLTPALPLALQGGVGGVPNFFIESFQIPPFLLPIFQAAGTAYGIPWQVLAAINEVETDYGRDLSVSSAGAEGWMQFLPSSWSSYGVDANGDGFKDPYNPADAIFAAARYLRAAGGASDIRGAIYSYNHSQAYVSSVMLRAQLLGGTPSELLGAITGLTEARFPVHAAAHFSDGFPTVHGASGASQDDRRHDDLRRRGRARDRRPGRRSRADRAARRRSGRFISLRDAYGNTYVYAQLGSVATVYPVIEPRVDSTVSAQIEHVRRGERTGAERSGDRGRAAALADLRSGDGLGPRARRGRRPRTGAAAAALPNRPSPRPAGRSRSRPHVRAFREGASDVYLHPLRAGVQVIAGTVLGHVGAGDAAAGEGAPHILFQIRPAGAGAPLIDPKPILDGWVALENSSVFHAKGENPFLATSPTVGQVLLESKQQLEPQVLRDAGIRLEPLRSPGHPRRARRQARAGDARVPVGVGPEADRRRARLRARRHRRRWPRTPAPAASGESITITAVNGVAGRRAPGAGHGRRHARPRAADAAGPRRGRGRSSAR